jgi:hypothetical protein
MSNAMASGPGNQRHAPTRGSLLFAALTAVTLACPLAGCGATGTSGDEGTVDLSAAKENAAQNPEIAKAAARRGGSLGGARLQSKGR